DSLRYENSYRTLRARSGDLPSGDFVPALMVWTHVQSRPEAGLAVLAMGRRDVSYDLDLPLALLSYRPSLPESPVEIGVGYSTATLYDQHVCLNCPPDSGLAVGDLVGFGISHPCTTFDKWQVLYVIDDHYDIVDAVRTFF